MGQTRKIDLTFLHTSDVHGSVFSYNYMTQQPSLGGIPAIFSQADSLRRELGDRLIITDGGDCLQGQPTAYYYNFVDTTSQHLIARVMNQMGYVCTVMGNHDIETGHPVYDRWVRDLNMPVLGANVIDTRTGRPYLTPYIIIERAGVKIALLGMVTPAIPYWLPEQLWSNLRFDDIVVTSRQWINTIQQREHPDLIVGIFHSGLRGGVDQPECHENAVEQTARQVPGFDFILYGHDHRAAVTDVVNVEGDTVKCMGPTNDAVRYVLAHVTLTFDDGKVVDKQIQGEVPFAKSEYSQYSNGQRVPNEHKELVAQLFEAEFVTDRLALNTWCNRHIGMLGDSLVERDAYFGSSRFIDFIHEMQLELTGADISFAAPLSYDAILPAGPITVNDMFRLYKFENFLYTMRLTGKEIKNFLEMDYGLWCNQMKSADDHIMLLKERPNKPGRMVFANLTYNMDSAAGIIYTVDVTKPQGGRINILSMADGTPFELEKDYKVAVNSYRGNGGGELLTLGAGIPRSQLASRILASTDKDLRYYLMKRIEQKQVVTPRAFHQWRFVPDDWAKPAIERDRKLLFGEE